ncbi:MAG: 5-methylcytosine-specific restriction endonuclease system specificity protein McrC [Senegalia sp. (in: firmicutes)]|uniref:5-methylcytosine-specific restriction endonuclease system specificity protein McrC n=1 Tax=Senegalia sp. (in: firmicutes) TaxID=1924098 RepID=UPI003F9D8FC6
MTSPKIPIKNIYHMLCYAWNELESSDEILVGNNKFDNIYNLFARIYINGVSTLIKRGLNKYYIREDEDLSTIKGKIDITGSIKVQSQINGRMICQYDEFSKDIVLNKIVKTTMNILIKSSYLNKNLKKELIKLRLYFNDINDLKLSKSLFSNLRYNRNNHHYRMLINISELIYEGLITNEEDGDMRFSDFVRDRKMAKLYEKFVLNFYKYKLDSRRYKIYSPKLRWDLDEDISQEDLLLLPEMKTDIVVEDKEKNIQLIIDTKFYSETLTKSYLSEIEKIKIANLYQIYAYVNNSDFKGTIEGILLYPTIEKEIDSIFPIDGKNIGVKTVNLDEDWEDIEGNLLVLIK